MEISFDSHCVSAFLWAPHTPRSPPRLLFRALREQRRPIGALQKAQMSLLPPESEALELLFSSVWKDVDPGNQSQSLEGQRESSLSRKVTNQLQVIQVACFFFFFVLRV